MKKIGSKLFSGNECLNYEVNLVSFMNFVLISWFEPKIKAKIL